MRILQFLLVALLLVSCNNDTDDSLDSSIAGEWTLTDVSCFCFFGEDYDFTQNSITVNAEANTIVVSNADEDSFFLAQNGTYQVAVDGNKITFENGEEYTYRIESDMLIITSVDTPEIADDGAIYSYKR